MLIGSPLARARHDWTARYRPSTDPAHLSGRRLSATGLQGRADLEGGLGDSNANLNQQ
jgi:hypothetical protein